MLCLEYSEPRVRVSRSVYGNLSEGKGVRRLDQNGFGDWVVGSERADRYSDICRQKWCPVKREVRFTHLSGRRTSKRVTLRSTG